MRGTLPDSEAAEDGKKRRGAWSGGTMTITPDRAPVPEWRGGGKPLWDKVSSWPRVLRLPRRRVKIAAASRF